MSVACHNRPSGGSGTTSGGPSGSTIDAPSSTSTLHLSITQSSDIPSISVDIPRDVAFNAGPGVGVVLAAVGVALML